VRTCVAAAALAAVLLVSGCGGGGHKARRNAVTDYIQRVNAAQVSMRAQLLAVERAYRDFGRKGGPSIAKIEPRLARAESTMRGVGRRIDALKPPPDARKLHALLVRLVSQEAEIAHGLVQLAQFSPRFSAALHPLGAAGAALRSAFKTTKTAKAQAVALDAYAASLAGVLRRLRSVEAPPAFEPALASQRSSLAHVRASALELAAGLRKNERAALPRLIQRFTNAGNASQSVVEQKARIAAIEAYNGRVDGLTTLGHAIDTERARLEKALH
jgi:uncharacterized protein with PIN domain